VKQRKQLKFFTVCADTPYSGNGREFVEERRQALLGAIDQGCREISEEAQRALDVVSTQGIPGPILYQEATRSVCRLGGMWRQHLRLLAHVHEQIPSSNESSTMLLTEIQRDAVPVVRQFEAIGAAPWPRTTEIGVKLIRGRVTEILLKTLQQMERERTKVLPMLRLQLRGHAPLPPAIVRLGA